MTRSMSLCYTLVFLIAFAAGHDGHSLYHSHRHIEEEKKNLTADEIFYCNATIPGEKDMIKANNVFNEWLATGGARKLQSDTPVQVPVYFHVITSLNGLLGSVSQSAIATQIDTLNESFQPYFAFELTDVEYVDNSSWYDGGLSFETTRPRSEMKFALRKGGSATLNIYITDSLVTDSGTILGLATFPDEYKSSPSEDGVVVWHGTLPGGICGDLCNSGYTAVHEVGHWLGLYHTFQALTTDGCVEGDDVDDTTKQAYSTSGCPIVAPDTCPTFPGRDPIENFMDYSDDSCKDPSRGDGFTPGQVQRMRGFWDIYREGDVVVPSSTPPEMTTPQDPSEVVDVYIEFQYDRFPDETAWQITNSGGDVVLSYPSGSGSGLLSGILQFPPDTYTVLILDSASDGTCCTYGSGYVLVAVNGAPAVGGYGIFQSSATVVFTVTSTSGAAIASSPTARSITVPEGTESTLVADGVPPLVTDSSAVQMRWICITLASLLLGALGLSE